MQRLLFVFLLLVSSMVTMAQAEWEPEYPRRWAVDAQIGGNIMPHSRLTGSQVPLQHMGSSSNNGLLTKFHLERYLDRGTHFSVKAGYEHEEVNLLENDFSSDLSQLMVGGRWYPAPNEWLVQPYVGTDFLWNVDADKGEFDMEASMTGYGYSVKGYDKMPRFSLGPVVGADLYLFSCIALQVEYSYRWGIDGRANGHYTDTSGHTAFRHSRVNRHALSLGLKVSFPFSFSQHDVNGLLDLLFGD